MRVTLGKRSGAPRPVRLATGWATGGLIAYAVVASVLVAVAGILFRSAALQIYSPLVAGFDGVYRFRALYLLEHRRFLTEPLATYSYWSLGVNTELGFYLMELVLAGVIQVHRWIGLPIRTIHQIILSTGLITLVQFLLLRGRLQAWAIVGSPLVAGMITLGTPVAIIYLGGWNSAYGWVLLLAVTAIATSNLHTVWCRLLTLAIAVSGPPLYHTFGFLLNVYIVLLWVCLNLVGMRGRVASPLLIVVCYLSYQVYVSVQFFRELSTGLIDVLTLEFLGRDTRKIAVAVVGAEEAYLRYIHLVIWALLSVPILLVVLRYVGAFRAGKAGAERADLAYVAAVTAMSGAVAMIAVLFGLKFSVEFMINRGAEYLIVPAVLATITELRLRRGAGRLYLIPLGVTVLALSLYSFTVQAPTVRASNFIGVAEAEGYSWLKGRLRPEDVVFTDFRLAGAFIADGHFRVLGVTGNRTEHTFDLLDRIYYHSSPATVTAAIDRVRTTSEDRPADYLFLSVQMLRNYPGLDGFGTHFQPVPARFFAVLAASPDWELVYENAQSRIYQRRTAPPAPASLSGR